MLQNGSMVQRYQYEEQDNYRTPVGYGPIGVVFNLQLSEDNEYVILESFDVRWMDGRLEHFQPTLDEKDDLFAEADEELNEVTPSLFVNVYLEDRAFGGREEGGWWYDTGEITEVIQCATPAEAEEVRAMKDRECDWRNEGRRPTSSVLSEGRYSVRLEEAPGEDFPARRPHYC